jgi:hypothetical protein
MKNFPFEFKTAVIHGVGVRLRGQALSLTVVTLALMLLAGCASTAKAPDIDPVRERAEARWSALLAGDLESAYNYYSPGYRSANSVIDFGVSWSTRRVRFTSADYAEHQCEDGRCSVAFDTGFTVERPVPGMDVFKGTQRIEETWIESDGQWWFVPKK